MSMFIEPPPSPTRKDPKPIPPQLWEYSLSPYTITVFAYLIALADGYILSSRRIADALGISRQRTEDSLEELLAAKMVSVQKFRTSAKREVNRYIVLQTSEWLPPGTERPVRKALVKQTENHSHDGMIPWV
jgi:hypothetical protein